VLAEIAAPFEEILHIGIMVVTQAAHGHALPVSLQFPSDIAVLAAVVGLQRETTVSPQLALGTETLGVCSCATSKAARIGPIEGIWRSNFTA
jgi:hypothetical protein